MVSTEEIYTLPPPAVGCLSVATKVFIVLAALSLFFLGLFVVIFVSVVANSLM